VFIENIECHISSEHQNLFLAFDVAIFGYGTGLNYYYYPLGIPKG